VLNLCSINDNLQGDVIFPVEAGVPTINWLGEVAADTAENVTFNQVTSVPTRAAQTVEMSRRVLLQEHSSGLQSRLTSIMNRGFNTGIETALLTGPGSGNAPTGIMTALNASAQVVGVPTHADLVNLFELILANADALRGRLAYVTDPATLAFLKTVVLDAGSGKFLAEGKLNEVLTSNGFPIYTTTAMPLFSAKHGMVFGNFEDVALNFWGGPVMMVNPYSKMKESLIEIYMERQMDVKVLRDASFAISKDIVYT
jgi:HK97 family phage major capsid protein